MISSWKIPALLLSLTSFVAVDALFSAPPPALVSQGALSMVKNNIFDYDTDYYFVLNCTRGATKDEIGEKH